MPNSKRFFQFKFIKKIVSMRITIPTWIVTIVHLSKLKYKVKFLNTTDWRQAKCSQTNSERMPSSVASH